ncbi:MAG: porin [Kiritimatiellae bacterium]|nr:porin [Kiritimatiellia bacterium]
MTGLRTQGVEVLEGEQSLNVNGQLQLHAAFEQIDDPHSSDGRLFLFLRQARLNVNGEFKGSQYEVEWMMGGEEVPESNTVMSLLDAYVDTPLNDTIGFKLGQFKVPYSRERLMDSGDAFHVNRSVGNNFFNIGRDVGAAIHMESGTFSGAFGLFTGGGINIPERYLPEDIGVPMIVARVGFNDGLDEDVFTPVNANTAWGKSGFAAYLNGMYNEDSRVGHSTPLNVKYYDKSLMLNSAWNPYIKARGEKAVFYQFGGDVAWQFEISKEASLLLTAEANISQIDNNQGTIESVGGLVSANVIMENWSFGIRYGIVEPDSEMAYTETDETTGAKTLHQITDKSIQEITPSVVYFIPDTGFKIIAEVSYQIDTPVSIENGNGAYNLMRQSDQVSYATSGGIELQDNYIANLIVQYSF